jgi:hypothetical protein
LELKCLVFGATSHAKEEKSKKQAGEERGNSGIFKHGLLELQKWRHTFCDTRKGALNKDSASLSSA